MRSRYIACLALAFLGVSRLSPQEGPLAGLDSGLYAIGKDRKPVLLWGGGGVRKIERVGDGWFLLTTKGVFHSRDLVSFSERNSGFPVKVIKRFSSGSKAFVTEIQEIKDLEADPFDPSVLAACTKDSAYVSTDAGLTWKAFPTPQPGIVGLKAVAVFSKPERVVAVSHPIKGVFWRRYDDPKSGWADISAGLPLIDTTTLVNEVSDIKVGTSGGRTTLAAGHSFLNAVSSLSWGDKAFSRLWTGKPGNGTVDGLSRGESDIAFATGSGPVFLNARAGTVTAFPEAESAIKAFSLPDGERPNAVAFRDSSGAWRSMSELWLVGRRETKPHRAKAENRNGIYLVTDFALNDKKMGSYFDLMRERGIDSLVIDMKDDYGNLRFSPRSPVLRKVGAAKRPIDVEAFVATAKARGVYLVARVVVFKDEVVRNYAGGQYAVWDATTKAPWRGYLDVQKKVEEAQPVPADPSKKPAPKYETVRQFMKEYWVDPYCEFVWQYNVEIAREIISRGFDEVQFDYIRFPTDGDNLGDATFRFRDKGMDKESALMSFLSYARENIDAPISIDIYGANGFYRTGVRTGQDVEILARYVDVICPMYYPSHFEQGFLAQEPANMRPFRIYHEGSFRNMVIARDSVVIRPYVQAFFYNVAYDRQYYDLDYVRRQAEGVRDSTNSGMTFWNNSGRYEDIPFLMMSTAGKLETVRIPGSGNGKL